MSVWGLGFAGFGLSGLEFRDVGFGFWGDRVSGPEFGIWGTGFWHLGFEV